MWLVTAQRQWTCHPPLPPLLPTHPKLRGLYFTGKTSQTNAENSTSSLFPWKLRVPWEITQGPRCYSPDLLPTLQRLIGCCRLMAHSENRRSGGEGLPLASPPLGVLIRCHCSLLSLAFPSLIPSFPSLPLVLFLTWHLPVLLFIMPSLGWLSPCFWQCFVPRHLSINAKIDFQGTQSSWDNLAGTCRAGSDWFWLWVIAWGSKVWSNSSLSGSLREGKETHSLNWRISSLTPTWRRAAPGYEALLGQNWAGAWGFSWERASRCKPLGMKTDGLLVPVLSCLVMNHFPDLGLRSLRGWRRSFLSPPFALNS